MDNCPAHTSAHTTTHANTPSTKLLKHDPCAQAKRRQALVDANQARIGNRLLPTVRFEKVLGSGESVRVTAENVAMSARRRDRHLTVFNGDARVQQFLSPLVFGLQLLFGIVEMLNKAVVNGFWRQRELITTNRLEIRAA